jgi:P pilus assembly chaperone PapD
MTTKFSTAGLLICSTAAAGAAMTGPALAHLAQSQAPAQSAAPAVSVNLNITPKRLVLDRANRLASVVIFNQGNTAATFNIAVDERIMAPSGEIRSVAEAQADPTMQPIVARLASARPYIVAVPRRVVLAPGQTQTIRVRADLPASAAGAEYRAHLTVTTVPPREAGVTAEQAASDRGDQLSFRINSVFGLAIPVIVRQGARDVRGELENVRLASADISPDGVRAPVRTPVLQLDIKRLGANSLFGNINVRAGRTVLGTARGVGVYLEIGSRALQIPLNRTPRAGEQLEVTYGDDDAAGARTIARTTFTVR